MNNLRIGVFGFAGAVDPTVAGLASHIGRLVAEKGFTLVTGATTGYPYIAARSALEFGGEVLGISPARNLEEHIDRYSKPTDGCSHIVFTGMGYTGRNFINARNADASVYIGGEAGTLEEFCASVYEGHVIGVLTNSGGVSALMPLIVETFTVDHGAQFVFHTDPDELIEAMVKRLRCKRTVESVKPDTHG